MKIQIIRNGEAFLPSGNYAGKIVSTRSVAGRLNGIGGCAHVATIITIRVGHLTHSGTIFESGNSPEILVHGEIPDGYEGEFSLVNDLADNPFGLFRVGSQEWGLGRFPTHAAALDEQERIILGMAGNWTSRFEIRYAGVVLTTRHRTP